MSLITRTRPVDAAMKALEVEGQTCAELRRRLEACDAKRFHLHRTLMRLRFAHDTEPTALTFWAEADALLTEVGYPSADRKEVA